MRIAAALLVVLGLAWSSTAEAALAPGDIALVGYNSSGPDAFAFVTLRDLPAGTSIAFTDCGWLSAGSFKNGEGIVTWSTAAVVPTGTQVSIAVATSTATTGTVVSTGGGGGVFSLATAGDQIIAYVGTHAIPTPIAAVTLDSTGWGNATNVNTTALPTGLTDGTTAVAVLPELQNAFYACAVDDGTPAALRTAIHTAANWTRSADAITLPITCSFTTPCGDAVCTGTEQIETCGSDCGLLDDFEDATTQGWQVGMNPQPAVLASGGPTGAGDAYLRLSADGSASHGKLAVFNPLQWTGDYTARGQTRVYLHAKAFNGSPRTVRAVVEDSGGTRAISAGVTVPADGDWHRVELDVSAGALTGGVPATILGDVAKLWIIHNPAATFPGPTVNGDLGLDNVSNTPLPNLCGDGDAAGAEVCDGSDLSGEDCGDHGYVATAGLECNGTCTAYVTSGCTAVCGNGNAEPGEPCDTGGNTASCDIDCTAVACNDGVCNAAGGETAGTCPADCASTCGDGLITNGEACDGTNLGGQDCTDHGFVAPAGLACGLTCAAFELSGCDPSCGNGTLEPGETCESGGVDTVACDGDCSAVTCGDAYCNDAVEDAAGCPDDCATTCGDGLITGAEACDGAALGGVDCTAYGFVDGAGLACNPLCADFDPEGCAPACANSVVEPGEACDSGGVDVADCDADCTVITCGDAHCNAVAGETAATCADDCATVCGDGLVTGNEKCDGTNLDGEDCTGSGFGEPDGLGCDADCLGVDSSGCSATCGNGNVEPGEGCDDGRTGSGDGCEADCSIESGYVCNGEPSECHLLGPDARIEYDATPMDAAAGYIAGGGGGCCQTGGGADDGAIWTLVVLGGLLVRRRRRVPRA